MSHVEYCLGLPEVASVGTRWGASVASGLKEYFDLVFREYDCYGTWLPGTGVALGDIGRITSGGAFQRSGNLATRAELPRSRVSDEPNQTIASASGVSFSAGGDVKVDQVAEAVLGAAAKLDITFARAGVAAMILEDVRRQEFQEEQDVRLVMQDLLRRNRIDEDEVVVTYIKEAVSGVIATTYDAGASRDVDVSAQLGSGTVTLSRVGGLLKVASIKSSQTVVTAGPGRPLTPMYRALVFAQNRHWWSFWRSYIAIGSAIPTRKRGSGSNQDLIAAARPSLARPAAES